MKEEIGSEEIVGMAEKICLEAFNAKRRSFPVSCLLRWVFLVLCSETFWIVSNSRINSFTKANFVAAGDVRADFVLVHFFSRQLLGTHWMYHHSHSYVTLSHISYVNKEDKHRSTFLFFICHLYRPPIWVSTFKIVFSVNCPLFFIMKEVFN